MQTITLNCCFAAVGGRQYFEMCYSQHFNKCLAKDFGMAVDKKEKFVQQHAADLKRHNAKRNLFTHIVIIGNIFITEQMVIDWVTSHRGIVFLQHL